jgi:hypothetical protein
LSFFEEFKIEGLLGLEGCIDPVEHLVYDGSHDLYFLFALGCQAFGEVGPHGHGRNP